MVQDDIRLPSRKEEVVLELLIREGPMYGLEIADKSDGEISRSAVYVTLARMVKKGFLSSDSTDLEPGEKGLPRRRYRIADAGERALKAKQLTRGFLSGKLIGV